MIRLIHLIRIRPFLCALYALALAAVLSVVIDFIQRENSWTELAAHRTPPLPDETGRLILVPPLDSKLVLDPDLVVTNALEAIAKKRGISVEQLVEELFEADLKERARRRSEQRG